MDPFEIIRPRNPVVPILISIPHCGTLIPEECRPIYDEQLLSFIDDTDWYVDQLYAFASQMGITTIKSKFSRWVIDLNRATNDQPLYNDGRIITGLVPLTNFKGTSLYLNKVPDQAEINRRISIYHEPYHRQLQTVLSELQSSFGHVLLWEAHSIRQHVPTIYDGILPDLNLGDNEGKSAHPKLISEAAKALISSRYDFTHNHPFKGGFITRNFGRPDQGIHALQLEMTKINYMNDTETDYDTDRADIMQKTLINTMEIMIKAIGTL